MTKSATCRISILTIRPGRFVTSSRTLAPGWPGGRCFSRPCLGPLHQDHDLLSVNLTRKQIEDSPSIESHKPVSRQYEEEYHRYYGWPCYWEGGNLWGMNPYPMLQIPPDFVPIRPVGESNQLPAGADTHLRSTLNVSGYRLEASDGKIGHVSNFMMDIQSWAITGWSSKPAGFPARKWRSPRVK